AGRCVPRNRDAVSGGPRFLRGRCVLPSARQRSDRPDGVRGHLHARRRRRDARACHAAWLRGKRAVAALLRGDRNRLGTVPLVAQVATGTVMDRTFLLAGAVAGFIGVAFGAFGAHGLRWRLSPEMLAVFETGVRYQMYHALALLLTAVMAGRLDGRAIVAA